MGMITTDGNLRIELIDTALYNDDPIGSKFYEQGIGQIIGFFVMSSCCGAWHLAAGWEADFIQELADKIHDDYCEGKHEPEN